MKLSEFYNKNAEIEAELLKKAFEIQLVEAKAINYESRTAVDKQLMEFMVGNSAYEKLLADHSELKGQARKFSIMRDGLSNLATVGASQETLEEFIANF